MASRFIRPRRCRSTTSSQCRSRRSDELHSALMTDSHDINYASYLKVDELLGLQQPRTKPEHPDELLFIVVHQASELWFKVILHELDALAAAFERTETMFA